MEAGAADSVVTDEHTPTALNAHQTESLGDIRAVTPPHPRPSTDVTKAAPAKGFSHSSPSGSANHSFAPGPAPLRFSGWGAASEALKNLPLAKARAYVVTETRNKSFVESHTNQV